MYYVIVRDFDIGEDGYTDTGIYSNIDVANQFFNEPFYPKEYSRTLYSAEFVNGELVTDYGNPISERNE